MRGIRISSLVSGVMLAGLCTATLPAAPIFGTFNIAGTITVTQNLITWTSNDAPFPADIARVGPGATGSFTGLDGANVTIANLDRATEPVGAPFTDTQFITFPTMPALPALDINFIFQGIYSNALCATLPATVGQTCTPGPPSSPFNFVNNPPPAPAGPQATATFVFSGETPDKQSTWTGNFTSQFNVPYQTVLAAFAPGGSGQVTNTYSATITVVPTVVPEPGPMVLTACGLGLVLFSIALRRRSRSRYN